MVGLPNLVSYPTVGENSPGTLSINPDRAQLSKSVNPDITLDVVLVGGALHRVMRKHAVESLVHLRAELQDEAQAVVDVHSRLLLQVQAVDDLVVVPLGVELGAVGEPVVDSIIRVRIAA